MSVSSTKIAGWILLLSGVLVIFYASYSSYAIFTGSNPVPEIFSYTENKTNMVSNGTKAINNNLSQIYKQTGNSQELQAQLQAQAQAQIQEEIGNQIASQMKSILPDNFMPKTLNLFSWSIFTGIMIFAGSSVSGIGVKLLKQ